MDPSSIRRSWRGVADAVGHCLIVFAFVPVAAALPGWIRFEVGNPLDLHDPVVLAFLPVRGMITLLDAFEVGVLPGGLAGIVDGLLLSAWVLTARDAATTYRQLAVGAICGALAASLVVAGVVLRGWLTVPDFAVPTLPIVFEIASGVVCGMIAAPTAVRLLAGIRAGEVAETLA